MHLRTKKNPVFNRGGVRLIPLKGWLDTDRFLSKHGFYRGFCHKILGLGVSGSNHFCRNYIPRKLTSLTRTQKQEIYWTTRFFFFFFLFVNTNFQGTKLVHLQEFNRLTCCSPVSTWAPLTGRERARQSRTLRSWKHLCCWGCARSWDGCSCCSPCLSSSLWRAGYCNNTGRRGSCGPWCRRTTKAAQNHPADILTPCKCARCRFEEDLTFHRSGRSGDAKVSSGYISYIFDICRTWNTIRFLWLLTFQPCKVQSNFPVSRPSSVKKPSVTRQKACTSSPKGIVRF